MSRKDETVAAVRELAVGICEDLGIELFDVVFVPGPRQSILRVYIDRDQGGVTIDDCTKVSRQLSTEMDVADMITGKYVLEVSSPGLDRPIRHLDDAAKLIGKTVRLSTSPIDGRKNYKGVLVEIRDESLVLEEDGTQLIVPWNKVRKGNLVYEF